MIYNKAKIYKIYKAHNNKAFMKIRAKYKNNMAIKTTIKMKMKTILRILYLITIMMRILINQDMILQLDHESAVVVFNNTLT